MLEIVAYVMIDWLGCIRITGYALKDKKTYAKVLLKPNPK